MLILYDALERISADIRRVLIDIPSGVKMLILIMLNIHDAPFIWGYKRVSTEILSVDYSCLPRVSLIHLRKLDCRSCLV